MKDKSPQVDLEKDEAPLDPSLVKDPSDAKSPAVTREKALEPRERLALIVAALGPFGKWWVRHFGSVEAQKAAGRKNPKERLVRHERGVRERENTLKALIRTLWRMTVAWMPYLAPIVAYLIWGKNDAATYFQNHLALALLPALPLLAAALYASNNRARTHPPERKGKPRREPRPALPSLRQHTKDIADIVANLDHLPLRLVYLVLLWGGTFVAGNTHPLSVDTFTRVPESPSDNLPLVFIPVAAAAAAFMVARTRTSFVIRERRKEIEEAYVIAASTLGYVTRLPKQNATGVQVREATPHQAINVKKWWALYEIDRAFVIAPQKLDVKKIDAWDDFSGNINVKLPRPEEWRVQRDPKGRGATIGPANYPRSVLWDGEFSPDPLTFWVGVNLETSAREFLTFSDVSPHMALSGGTSSGKPLPLDQIIPTPSGFRTVGSLNVGDEVYLPSGKPVRLRGLSEIETPEKAYRITFDDGGAVVTSGTHPWVTHDDVAALGTPPVPDEGDAWLDAATRGRLADVIAQSAPGGEITVMEALSLACDPDALDAALRAFQDGTLGADADAAASVREERERDVMTQIGDVLGVTREVAFSMGDVAPHETSTVTVKTYPRIPFLKTLVARGQYPLADESFLASLPRVRTTDEIAQSVREGHSHLIPAASAVERPAAALARDPYMVGSETSGPVPPEYLHGSTEQRMALFEGMVQRFALTTSGLSTFVDNPGAVTLPFTDSMSAEQARTLASSLGGIARIREGDGVWEVVATLPEYEPESLAHRIVSVEEVEPVPMRCFAVDDDEHQFLVGLTYVATHNTSLAEIIAAQVLLTPMPWDPSLYGRVVIVDPKGPFARRWIGRPGVVVADGQQDAAEPDEDGNPVTGPLVMAACMQWVEEEHQRRANVLAKYAEAATWIDLPADEKRREGFMPIVVILDEYIDHTDTESANGDERIERENMARGVITRLASWHARKYRNVGMHTILIAQEVKMTGNTGIGSVLLRQLAVRAVTGQMDPSQLRTMFGDVVVPSIPSTKVVIEDGERQTKTIPGRARIMNAGGQSINKVQVPYFGGDNNIDTLNKWLPRGEKAPNGDFTLPSGKPRTPEDFDENGNLIEENEVIEEDPILDRPAPEHDDFEDDLNDAYGDSPSDDEDEDAEEGYSEDETPEVDSSPEGGADEDDEPPMDDDPPGDTAPETFEDDIPESEIDPGATFPAATAEDFCWHEGCEEVADGKCLQCGQTYCSEHSSYDPIPDPDLAHGLYCVDCVKTHPLVASGLAAVYSTMLREAARVDKGFTTSWARQEDGSVRALIVLDTGKKLIEVRSSEGTLVSRSRSGSHTGEDDVIEHILDVIGAYTD